MIVTLLPTPTALIHPRFGSEARRLLAAAWRSAFSAKPERECFCCCRPWLRKRAPRSVLLVEHVAGGDGDFTAGVCAACTGRADLPARVRAAMERDLGFEAKHWRFMAEAGPA